jgi:glucan biosynthesis protein C
MAHNDSDIQRRYDLDWLRVLVFGVLIFYHVGMLYVADWGFHYKSEHRSFWLQNLMILVNQWRLPLLFLISGIAMRFMLAKVSLGRFVAMRSFRLWVPLLFGIWVVVPPQLYVEMLSKGELPAVSYGQFYTAFFDLSHPWFRDHQSGIFPHVDVNHLWYIRELWYFSMYLLAGYLLLRLLRLMPWLERPFANWGLLPLTLMLMVGLTVLQLWWFPEDAEGLRKARGFAFMCCGFLIGWQPRFWQQVAARRTVLLALAVLSFAILISYYHLYFVGRTASPGPGWEALETALVYVNRWLWLLAILGYANAWLNRPHRWLDYLNEAVYPWYILHQSILIVAAWWLADQHWGPVLEPLWVIGLTIAGCCLGYELIRRSAVLRLLFGLKIGRTPTSVKDH